MSVAGWEASLRASLLTPSSPWRAVDVLAQVDSTNAESLRRPSGWRVVAAGEQTAGRGRRSRTWISPPGQSVSVSLTVPLASDPDRWGWLPLLTGMAMRSALCRLTGAGDQFSLNEQFSLKWPNDVLVRVSSAPGAPVSSAPGAPSSSAPGEWAKVCGVLCEISGSLVVAGAGVNVGVPQADLPAPGTTSLQLCGHPGTSRRALIAAFASDFAALHGQWCGTEQQLETIRAEYRRHCRSVGARVRIDLPDGQQITGQASGIDDSGRIVLDDGQTQRAFAAGDVVHLRPQDPQAVS